MQALHRYARAVAWPWHGPRPFRDGLLTATEVAKAPLDAATRDVSHRLYPTGDPIIPALIAEARTLITPAGEAYTLRVDHADPGREILRWRALTMRLPPGMLVAAGARRGRAPLDVRLLARISAPTTPIAHLHLHANAAISFELVWAHICGRSPSTVADGPAGIPADEWLGWLARARLVRLVLHRRLANPNRPWHALLGRPKGPVVEAVRALYRGQLPSVPMAATRINALADTPQRSTSDVDDIWRNDPLHTDHPWPEGWLLQRAFAEANARPTGRFARLFAQYLRIRCLLYRHLVDDPAETGLDDFAATYDALRDYRQGLGAVFPQIATREAPLDLGALEVRTGPPDGPAEIRELARQLRDARRGHARRTGRAIEIGWIFHVIRDTKRSEPYVTQARSVRRKLQPLMTALTLHPALLRTVRGLDIAGREMAGPLWLALPALRRVMALSRRLAARHHVPPLQLSVHAGEDFRHLASGLRSIDEPLHWNVLTRGDRLGHALALGRDAATWVERNARVDVPVWSRLLDLLWMIERIRGTTNATLRERVVDLPYLQSQRDLLLERLGWRAPLESSREVWRTLGDTHRVERLINDRHGRTEAEALVCARLFGPRDGRLDEPVEVETAPERDTLIALRAAVAQRVARRQVVVELNPSSNLSVAGFAHPIDQPHYHLLPWTQTDAPRPMLTLSADDPLQFATCLADEYAYAWAGLTLGAGYRDDEVRAWLDDVAATSWRARFTR